MLSTILFIILTIMRAVIAVLLIRTGLRKESRSVIWLAGLFGLTIVFSLSGAGMPIPLAWVVVFQGLAQGCLVMFLTTTFYNNRPSPLPYFMGFTVLMIFVGLILAISGSVLWISSPVSVLSVVVLPQIANWIWNAVAARQGLQGVEKDKYVEDWVKSRYKLMIVYSLVFLIPCGLAPFLSVLPRPVVLVAFLLAFFVLVVQYLVWGMPEFFRKYLNRNYKPVRVNFDQILSMSEDEIMSLAK